MNRISRCYTKDPPSWDSKRVLRQHLGKKNTFWCDDPFVGLRQPLKLLFGIYHAYVLISLTQGVVDKIFVIFFPSKSVACDF